METPESGKECGQEGKMKLEADRMKQREFYEAILHFEESEEAQDYYYDVMARGTGRFLPDGHEETVRERILKAYAFLFCENKVEFGKEADVDDVADTADRLLLWILPPSFPESSAEVIIPAGLTVAASFATRSTTT